MKTLHRRAWFASVLAIAALAIPTATAQADLLRISFGSKSDSCESCDSGCSTGCATCPQCNASCQLEIKQGKEKKSCFKTECKTICIPKVRFPWQKCCEPRCAKAKTVKVLKKHSYECPKCEYKWTPVPCGNGCCGANGGCAEMSTEVPTPAAEPTPAEVPTPPSTSYRYFSDGTTR